MKTIFDSYVALKRADTQLLELLLDLRLLAREHFSNPTNVGAKDAYESALHLFGLGLAVRDDKAAELDEIYMEGDYAGQR